MASVFLKRGKFWARICGDKEPKKWSSVPTGETDRDAAMRFAKAAQKAIDARPIAASTRSLRTWVGIWLERRKEAGHDWKRDRGKLEKHVLPELGNIELPNLTTKHVADLVHDLRFKTKAAPRTVRNIYSVLAAALRDAAIDGRIAVSPCTLTDVQLGEVVDADPEWRDGAWFARAEVERLISEPRIPLDRRVAYAFGMLAGMRPGEYNALRWRHYDSAYAPLGKLTVALSYNSDNDAVKRTKTKAVRHVPVHPTLAEILEEWRRAWSGVFGRQPELDDLILPQPPADAARRTKRKGEPFRPTYYGGKRWVKHDEPILMEGAEPGWTHRDVYDCRSTFITLAVEDGARREVLRDRITHTKMKRNAFDGYDRGIHWMETCHELAKLSIRYLAPTLLPAIPCQSSKQLSAPEEGIEPSGSHANARVRPLQVHDDTGPSRSSCDHGRALLLATVRPPQENDE